MITSMLKKRWVWVLSLTMLMVLVAAACGSDPTAAPEPTATPTPPTATSVPATATTVPPTATPVPPAPTSMPETEEEPAAMNPLETLVITPATTGRELFGPLSEEETNCIKSNIGEAFFGLMMDAPIAQASAVQLRLLPYSGVSRRKTWYSLAWRSWKPNLPGGKRKRGRALRRSGGDIRTRYT